MKRGREFDVVMLSRHYVAAQHIDTVRRFAPHARVVFDTVDLHFLREERLAALDGGGGATISAGAKRDEELALIAKADVTRRRFGSRSRQLLGALAPDARVVLVSNVHDAVRGGRAVAASGRVSCSSADSSIRRTSTRCCGMRARCCRTCGGACPASRRT